MKTYLTVLCVVMFAATFVKAADESTAGSFSLRADGGVAMRLTTPQTRWFDDGGGLNLKVFYNINDWISVGPSVAFLALAQGASQPFTQGTGTAWFFGGSLMLKKPYNLDPKYSVNVTGWRDVSFWVDGDVFYSHTGSLNRPALAVAAGASFVVNDARTFRIGPFVRYVDIIQYGTSDSYDKDAKTLVVGLTIEFGQGVKRVEPVPECKCVAPVCPVVKKEIPELKESIFFLCDKATILPASLPVLDTVVKAMMDNPTVKLQINGYASKEGLEGHNQILSERRAKAVFDYMVARGIAPERLTMRGFDSMAPMASDGIRSALEMNRRVDFFIKAQ